MFRPVAAAAALLVVAAACSSSSSSHVACASNNDCEAGEVCMDEAGKTACVPICSNDAACGSGMVCTNSICVSGARTQPVVSAVTGNGSASDIFFDGIAIDGANLEGSLVALSGAMDATLDVVAMTDARIEASLPLDLVEGNYTLTVTNAAGSAQVAVSILKGEKGDPQDGPSVLTLLAGVDGAGSGLDADLVDGHHAAEFLTVNDFAASANQFANLLTNGGMEAWHNGVDVYPNAWEAVDATAAGGSSVAQDTGAEGSYAIRLDDQDTAKTFAAVQVVSAAAPATLIGRTVTLTVWVKKIWAAGADGHLEINDGVGSSTLNLTATTAWQRVELSHTIASGATELSVVLSPVQSPDQTGTWEFDAAMLSVGGLAVDYRPAASDFRNYAYIRGSAPGTQAVTTAWSKLSTFGDRLQLTTRGNPIRVVMQVQLRYDPKTTTPTGRPGGTFDIRVDGVTCFNGSPGVSNNWDNTLANYAETINIMAICDAPAGAHTISAWAASEHFELQIENNDTTQSLMFAEEL